MYGNLIQEDKRKPGKHWISKSKNFCGELNGTKPLILPVDTSHSWAGRQKTWIYSAPSKKRTEILTFPIFRS